MADGLDSGGVMLLENVRFEPGETKNDPELARALSEIGDLYVNDAFGTAHRAHASTAGVAGYLPSYAGLLLQSEVENLDAVADDPTRPLVSFTVFALALPMISFVYGNYGFDTLFWLMATSAAIIFVAVACLPSKLPQPAAAVA